MSSYVQEEIAKKNRWVYFHKGRWMVHIVYWLSVLLINYFSSKTPITNLGRYIGVNFALNNLTIALYYYIYCLVLIPYFYKRNKHRIFWAMFVLSILTLPIVSYWCYKWLSVYFPEFKLESTTTLGKFYFGMMASYVVNFLVFAMLLYFMERSERQDTLRELDLERQQIHQVELDTLKMRIDPEFLMRSLTQLKGMTIDNKAEAPGAIINFSDLLRYRLYKGQLDEAPLKEEISSLKTLVHFLRMDNPNNKLHIQLAVQGEVEGKSVLPLSLINCFEPFCKEAPAKETNLTIMVLIEELELSASFLFEEGPTQALLDDLENCRSKYVSLYADKINFKLTYDDKSCSLDLSLPLHLIPIQEGILLPS